MCPKQSRLECNSHLVVEDLGLSALSRGDQVAVKALEDVLADLGQLGLDLLAVLLDQSNLGLVALGLLLLLDRRDDAPRGTSCANDVLVSDGQEVALINGEFTANLHSVRSYYSVLPHHCGPVLAQRRGGVGIP